ncbi:MAG: fructose bisphosphate aldolase [Sphaerochaetaceae bacterium]|jgi:fructose-bisphosphate aldolase class I
MDMTQYDRMRSGNGFIAALDQSGGSTPKALALYGIGKDAYASDQEMFDLVHEMRTRIIKSPAFSSAYILGAILFENTMDRTIDGKPTADYLWKTKNIIPFLKVDKGLAPLANGVQLMNPMPKLDDLLRSATQHSIFGTKMRSVIKEANPKGIKAVVDQQFAIAKQIIAFGLVPIIEPEVDIHSPDKAESENILKAEIVAQLQKLDKNDRIMLKISIPTTTDFYADVMRDPHMVRVVALSGGYGREEADELLAQNHGLIASFSRALSEGLKAQQSDAEFNATLASSIKNIYAASIT